MKAFCLVMLVLAAAWECGVTPGTQQKPMKKASHRHLEERDTEYSPIRLTFFYYDFDLGDADSNLLFEDTLVPSVKELFSSVLLVQRIQDNLVLQGVTYCGASVLVPDSHQTLGIPDTDVVIYLTSQHDETVAYAASALACAIEGGLRSNVVAGQILINAAFYNDMSFSDKLGTLTHEVVHVLGFLSSLYDYFQDPITFQYFAEEDIMGAYDVRGTTKNFIHSTTVLQKAREIYACEDLVGLELEEYSGAGNSHWDKRMVLNEVMIAHSADDPILSVFTLALLKDSGWYDVNWDNAGQPLFGKGEGCTFSNTTCVVDEQAQFQEFCYESGDFCDIFHLHESFCYITTWESDLPEKFQYFTDPKKGGADYYADYCPIKKARSSGDCRDPEKFYGNTEKVIGETAGPNSRCLEGTLVQVDHSHSPEYHTGCYEVVQCLDDRARISVGNSEVGYSIVDCLFTGNTVTVSGFEGHLVCPSSDVLCGEVPCRNMCYGFGSCVQGHCQCVEGRSGTDCSIRCFDTCATCSDSGQFECLSCKAGTELSAEGSCDCPAGYEFLNSECQSTDCSQDCRTCQETDPSYCLACTDSLREAEQGECLCIQGYEDNAGECLYQCEPACAVCAASVCYECIAFSETVDGVCTCIANYYELDGECLACDDIANCLSCQSEIGCTECSTGYYAVSGQCAECTTLDNCTSDCTTAGECITCVYGYYSDEGICVPCSQITGCISCTSLNECSVCKSDYYLDGGICIACSTIEKCVECTGANECTTCQDPYYEQGGVCHTDCQELCADCNTLEGVCTTCKEHAELTESGECVCEYGYDGQTECERCVNYYSKSEVVAEFSKNYDDIHFFFAEPVLSLPLLCSDIFEDATLLRLGNSPACAWVSSSFLDVSLGYNFSVQSETAYMRANNINKATLSCSSEFAPLSPEIQFSDNLPIPIAHISGPEVYSIPCGSGFLDLSAAGSSGVTKNELTRKWTSPTPEIASLLSGINASTVSISLESIFAGNHTISVTVTNSFGFSDTASLNVELSNTQGLTVEILGGPNVTVKASEAFVVEPTVMMNCPAAGEVEYQWSYQGSPDIDGASIAQQATYQMRINPGDLPLPDSYPFQVVLTLDTFVRTVDFIVKISPGDVFAVISMLDGEISTLEELHLDGSNSYYLPNTEFELSYKWLCVSKGGVCLDPSGNVLDFDSSLSSLTIPASCLKEFSTYTFILEVEIFAKSQFSAVSLTAVRNPVKLPDSVEAETKTRVDQTFSLVPTIEELSEENVVWYQVYGEEVQPTSTLSSYLLFEPGTMNEGAYYAWALEVTGGEDRLVFVYLWSTNRGPDCLGGITTEIQSFTSGDYYVITMHDCYDLDGEDLPLSYVFGYVVSDKFYPFTGLWSTNVCYVPVMSMSIKFAAKVLDAMESEKLFVMEYTMSGRRLQTSREVEEFTPHLNFQTLGIAVFAETSQAISAQRWDQLMQLLEENEEETQDDRTYDSILVAVSNLVEQEVVDRSRFVQYLELVKAIADEDSFIATTSALEMVLDTLDSHLQSYLDDLSVIEQVGAMLFSLLKSLTQDSLPQSIPVVAGSAVVYLRKARETGLSLQNQTVSIQDHSVSIPSGLPIENNTIVDCTIIVYPPTDETSEIVSISISNSGVYDATPLLSEETSIFIESMDEPFLIEMHFQTDEDAECVVLKDKEWKAENCKILSEGTESVQVALYETGIVTIRVASPDSLWAYLVVALCIILVTFLCVGLVISLLKRQPESYSIVASPEKATIDDPQSTKSMKKLGGATVYDLKPTQAVPQEEHSRWWRRFALDYILVWCQSAPFQLPKWFTTVSSLLLTLSVTGVLIFLFEEPASAAPTILYGFLSAVLVLILVNVCNCPAGSTQLRGSLLVLLDVLAIGSTLFLSVAQPEVALSWIVTFGIGSTVQLGICQTLYSAVRAFSVTK